MGEPESPGCWGCDNDPGTERWHRGARCPSWQGEEKKTFKCRSQHRSGPTWSGSGDVFTERPQTHGRGKESGTESPQAVGRSPKSTGNPKPGLSLAVASSIHPDILMWMVRAWVSLPPAPNSDFGCNSIKTRVFQTPLLWYKTRHLLPEVFLIWNYFAC